MKRASFKTKLIAGLVVAASTSVYADSELNIYSSRHYDTDERLYTDFEEKTGIKINRIEGNADELITRMVSEGDNSPADILLTVDTSRLERAKDAGVLQAIDSDVLESKIPAYLQDDENQWFGFSQRARILFYDKNDVQDPPQSYEELADPKYKGQICIRSSSNVYTQTITAALIGHLGEEAVSDWAKGVVANFARDPQGGDTDQLRGIVSGECDIAMSNTYYFGRALRKDVSGVSDSVDMIGWVFPNQNSYGSHMNLSGGGVAAHAPNKENAIKFLEYLASESAQEYFSAGNDEYPAVPGVGLSPSVAQLGLFKPDDLDAATIADNVPAAQKLLNESGWK
ncbi:Fe(3+) ABC transporter substrate-binding protein [Salinibius halmophilus]|uniref:Fe(3+) ABC transporter substrate-binding protein n=1 Tax=Salinibius halmophilus TaxID=1853216 RepID=UPI000E66D232|nr:Fe(3+) ABC transporter substrate-binding protein [Salinibius halmophilus]